MNNIISNSNNNIFFYWDGSISETRLKILVDSVYSTRVFNEDRQIYMISNTLNQDVFDDKFNVRVIKWDESFFYDSGINLEFLRKNYFNTHPREFSDLFRLVLLHRFGGSYIDTDDLCINRMSSKPNIICRSYDPHTSFYSHVLPENCVDGKYREIGGYDELNMYPRNDCWQNFQSGHYLINELLTHNKFLNTNKAIYIGDDFSWQSLINETINKNIDKIGSDFNYGLTLLYLYENFVAASSFYDRCMHGGEMCDIYNKLPDLKNYEWGFYKCDIDVATWFYSTVINKYPYLSHMWLHLKDMEKEWFIDVNIHEKYLLSTWIYWFIKYKINTYK